MVENSELRKRILIVDDDESVRDLISRVLQYQSRYEIISARDGIEALEILRKGEKCGNIYGIVTDINMPCLDGIGLAKEIDKNGRKYPILFVSGHGADSEIVYSGPRGFLSKPFSIEALLNNAKKLFG